jgi:hypothetical protein
VHEACHPTPSSKQQPQFLHHRSGVVLITSCRSVVIPPQGQCCLWYEIIVSRCQKRLSVTFRRNIIVLVHGCYKVDIIGNWFARSQGSRNWLLRARYLKLLATRGEVYAGVHVVHSGVCTPNIFEWNFCQKRGLTIIWSCSLKQRRLKLRLRRHPKLNFRLGQTLVSQQQYPVKCVAKDPT